MRQPSFLWKLFLGFSLVIFLAMAALQLFVSRRIEADGREQIAAALLNRSLLLGELALPALRGGNESALRLRLDRLGEQADTRLTVIDVDGRVIADSDEDPAHMSSHADRPEIREARNAEIGRAIRYSDTLRKRMMYVALPLRDGRTLLGYARSSLPMDTVDIQISSLRRTVLFGTVLALLATLAASLIFTRHITRPLTTVVNTVREYSAGDYGRRIPSSGGGELGELADAFNAMAQQQQERLTKISEERNKLEAILTGMVEGVVAVNHEDRILHMNEVAAALLGVSPPDARGHTLWELSPPEEIGEIVEACREGGRSLRREMRRDGADGERIIEVYASPLPSEGSGSTGGAVLVFHEITELRRLEMVRRDFVANVSHELKTPLTVIRGMVETMEDDPEMPPDTRDRFLGKVRFQAEHLSSQVSDLLALSRLESEEQSLAKEPVDMIRLVRDVSMVRAAAAESRGLRFTTKIPDGPINVNGDRLSLEQAFGNLVDNALVYTPRGGRVTLRLRTEGDLLLFRVEDTGIGIEPEHQERIFERFYRVDKARSREQGGTGLGLAIVKHVVLAHGGEVGLDSVPGRGTTFTISLPITA